MSDIVELIDWLRTAPSTEWCSPMLNKAADELERLHAAMDEIVKATDVGAYFTARRVAAQCL
jgi:hypothetical protein